MGRNPESNQKQRDQQRDTILQASLLLFVRRGFGSTKISDIAGAADISQGLLYHYFANKDEILLALLTNALPRLEAAAAALLASPQPAGDKLKLALVELFRGIKEREETGLYHLLVAQVSASEAMPPAVRTLLDRHARTPYRLIAKLIEQGQSEGTVRPMSPKDGAALFWSLVKGVAIHHAVHGTTLGWPAAESVFPLFFPEETPCKV